MFSFITNTLHSLSHSHLESPINLNKHSFGFWRQNHNIQTFSLTGIRTRWLLAVRKQCKPPNYCVPLCLNPFAIQMNTLTNPESLLLQRLGARFSVFCNQFACLCGSLLQQVVIHPSNLTDGFDQRELQQHTRGAYASPVRPEPRVGGRSVGNPRRCWILFIWNNMTLRAGPARPAGWPA